MHNIGDLIIYSGHGICRIDDITEKQFAGRKQKYYVLEPLENSHGLTINTPVENEKKLIFKLMDKKEAEQIIESFRSQGVEWIDQTQQRIKTYTNIIDSGDRMEIAKVANTLLRKKQEVEAEGKKFYENDGKILRQIKRNLFEELAIATDTSIEEINNQINRSLQEKDVLVK